MGGVRDGDGRVVKEIDFGYSIKDTQTFGVYNVQGHVLYGRLEDSAIVG